MHGATVSWPISTPLLPALTLRPLNAVLSAAPAERAEASGEAAGPRLLTERIVWLWQMGCDRLVLISWIVLEMQGLDVSNVLAAAQEATVTSQQVTSWTFRVQRKAYHHRQWDRGHNHRISRTQHVNHHIVKSWYSAGLLHLTDKFETMSRKEKLVPGCLDICMGSRREIVGESASAKTQGSHQLAVDRR